jgi:hypothetical protein
MTIIIYKTSVGAALSHVPIKETPKLRPALAI